MPNVPTPLLLVYQERLGLSPEVLTALFGCYAAGLVPALLLAGQLSDRLGRRLVGVGPALAVAHDPAALGLDREQAGRERGHDPDPVQVGAALNPASVAKLACMPNGS